MFLLYFNETETKPKHQEVNNRISLSNDPIRILCEFAVNGFVLLGAGYNISSEAALNIPIDQKYVALEYDNYNDYLISFCNDIPSVMTTMMTDSTNLGLIESRIYVSNQLLITLVVLISIMTLLLITSMIYLIFFYNKNNRHKKT